MKYIFFHLCSNDADVSFVLVPVNDQTATAFAMLPDILEAVQRATAICTQFPLSPPPKATLELMLPQAIAFDTYEEAADAIGLGENGVLGIQHTQIVDIPFAPEQIHQLKNNALWSSYVSDIRLVPEGSVVWVLQGQSSDAGNQLVESMEFSITELSQRLIESAPA